MTGTWRDRAQSARRKVRPAGQWYVPLLAALTAAALASCGGSDDDRSDTENQEPRDYVMFAAHVAQLVVEADDEACESMARIDRRSLEQISCPPPSPLRKRLASFEIASANRYNEVGVVRYIRGETGQMATMIVYLDSRRRWSVERLEIGAGPQADNSGDEGATVLDATIKGYLRAARARDCQALERLTYRPADDDPLLTYHPRGSEPLSCDAQLAKTEELAAELEAHPSQAPALIGGDQDFHFYSLATLDTTRKHYIFTVLRALTDGRERYFVLDFLENAQQTV